MVSKKTIDLGASDDESKNSKSILSINKKYADKYDNWRNKEELQKLKDKYGDVDMDDESSSDESEDEDAKELTEEVEKEFLKALSLVKSRDPKIYDKNNCKFFDDLNKRAEEEDETSDENEKLLNKKSKKENKKQVTLKDLEREMILKKLKKSDENLDNTNIYEDDEYHNEELKQKSKKGYYEEQDEIKEKLKDVVKMNSEDEEEEEEDFLKVKSKSKEERDKEEAEYIEWLKGKKEKVKDPELEKSMKYLHDYWNDPKLTYEEKYLRDFILNKRYLEKSSDEENSEDEEDTVIKTVRNLEKDPRLDQPLDYVDLSEEEKIVENQETFERKFNFRFEEPDPEFIKSYPRTVADSMRRKETKRKEKRKEYKERKEAEKQKKKEEIKRLKSLKRKEIIGKLEKLKKITGNYDLKLDVDDLDKDFDPLEYEKKMEAIFNDEYYQQTDPDINNDPDNEDDKPVFTDDEEEDLKYMNWDEWAGEEEKEVEEDPKKKKKKKKKKNEDALEEPEFIMDADYDPSVELAKGKKKGKFAEAVLKKKPVFDPNEKSFEEYFEEYYKLDCEDVIGGDLPCRFKYREVVPNDFGLTVEEILESKDTELNQWASLKKTIQYRPIQEEISDTKIYKNKKDQIDLKKKILASYYNPVEKEDDSEEEGETKEEGEEPKENEKKSETQIKSAKKSKKEKSDKNGESIEIKESKEASVKKIDKSKKSENGRIDKEKKVKDKNGIHKSKKKRKNKNIMESLTDERLAAYGINPKKFKKKLKFSKKNSENTENKN